MYLPAFDPIKKVPKPPRSGPDNVSRKRVHLPVQFASSCVRPTRLALVRHDSSVRKLRYRVCQGQDTSDLRRIRYTRPSKHCLSFGCDRRGTLASDRGGRFSISLVAFRTAPSTMRDSQPGDHLFRLPPENSIERYHVTREP